MGGMQERQLAVAAPPHCLPLEWTPLDPGSTVGVGAPAKEMGSLFGSRCLSDSWKVPALVQPPVPYA